MSTDPIATKAVRPRPTGTIYVLEITPKWHPLLGKKPRPGKACLYVGETRRSVRERFNEHLTGRSLPGRKAKASVRPIGRMLGENGGSDLVEGVDLVVRDDLAAPYNARPLRTSADNLKAEQRAASDLRSLGHVVYSNGIKTRKRRVRSS